MKAVKMTQRQLASGYIRTYLSGEFDSATEWMARLSALLDASEDGGDGSLSDVQWDALRDFRNAHAQAELTGRAVLDALGLDEEGNTRK